MAFKKAAMWLCCQAEVVKTAKELQVSSVPVVPFYLPRSYRGAYHPWFHCVLLNVRKNQMEKATLSALKMLARHEMRHHWQRKNYREVCEWWDAHPDAYKRQYLNPVCWPEEDARCFAAGKAAPNGPLTVPELEALYSSGQL